jgi:hypothetical protein
LIQRTQPQTTRPLGSTPTASSRDFTATTSQSASAPRIGTPSLTVSPLGNLPLAADDGSIGTRLLTFRAGAADQAHVACMPGTTWPVNGHPPGSSRDYPPAPVLMPANLFRHVNGCNARLPDPRLTREPGLFPHRSPRQSSTNAAVGGLKPPPAGRLRRANNPSSPAQHRPQKLTYHAPFDVRDTHGSRLREPALSALTLAVSSAAYVNRCGTPATRGSSSASYFDLKKSGAAESPLVDE